MALYTKPRSVELPDLREFSKTVAKEVVGRNIKFVIAEKVRKQKKTAYYCRGLQTMSLSIILHRRQSVGRSISVRRTSASPAIQQQSCD